MTDQSKNTNLNHSSEKKLEEEKQEFLAIVSHELKMPLSDMKNYLSIILEGEVGPISEDIKDYLAQTYTINDYLIRLIERITRVSRIQSGRLEPKLSRINITREIKLVVADFRIPAFEKGQTLEYKTQDNYSVKADPDYVWEILNNLISNAIKFTPKGGEININSYKEGDQVITEVKDTGIGVKKEDQDKIFEIFAKVHLPEAMKEKGTGVGLYLSKKLAETLGGRLWLKQSEKDKGSTFCFSLPISKG